MKNLIHIQREYIETVNASLDRWSHRKDGGHSSRVIRGARKKALVELKRLGFSDDQSNAMIKDAHDVMALERAAVDDPLNNAD